MPGQTGCARIKCRFAAARVKKAIEMPGYTGCARIKCRFAAACTEEHIGDVLRGLLAQLGERQVRNLEVRGSIPLWSI